jgi:hypothetical protein
MSETVSADEVGRLKDEVAQLQARLDRRQRRRARGRQAGLACLLVLGCGLVARSLIAAYLHARS